MHDQLLQALLNIADVRLVAAYTDNGLGLDSDSIQVCLPDLHLLSEKRRADFSYGTNYDKDLLVNLAKALQELSSDAPAAGQRVDVFQLGDYLDLWREAPPAQLDETVPDRIKDSHRALIDILEGEALNTGFLLGNHDFDLYRFVAYNTWERRFFLPGDDPRIVVMHGDYFDWIECSLPEAVRDIAVYYFGPSQHASNVLIGQMQNLRARCMRPDYGQSIQLRHASLSSSRAVSGAIPANFNLQQAGDPSASADGLKFLDQACAECVRANGESDTKLRMVIIGHTHHARIATKQMPDGTPFALVDVGAWIENCIEQDQREPIPNAQIAALSDNQVRIYELVPK